ncbi:MAG: hypothetical protein Fur0012_03120 [Elusimicrobiota bacterium]
MNLKLNRKDLKSAFFNSLFIFFVFSSLLSAETRIKTVEYNFGGYYSATNLASATQYNFPARNIKLPENGKNIRSAWLEYEGFTAAAKNINPIVIYFDAALTPSSARFTSGQYTVQTGESIILFAKADVTSVIQSQINNLASGVNFAAGIRITGPASNSHTIKLFITYEYDDESPLQVKTVRFPLYSDYANKIASFLSQQAAGTRSMQYLADIAETNSFNIQQQWFEIKGYRQDPGSKTDGSIYLNIGGGANEPTMYLDSGLRDSYYFRYLSSSTIVPGFSTGTLQTVSIVYTQNAINTLGGEVVITYEFSPASSYKTETASFYWGQYISSGVATSYYFGKPLVLKEEAVTIKEMYLKIYGSYDGTTAGNITLLSHIGATAGTSRSYAQIVKQAQISGYEFIHSLSDIASSWTNAAVVGSTITLPLNGGAHGMELIVTYSYGNGAAHTTNYSVYGGNSTLYTTHPYSYTSNTYWVEAGSSKTLDSAYLKANFLSNSATGDFSTILGFNGNSPQSAFNKTTTEATMTKRLYQNNSQVLIGTSSVTSNYSSSVSRGPMGGQLGISYGYVPPPKIPALTNQYIPGGAQISPGQWINSSAVKFEGVLSSSMSADTLYLVVEIKPNASSFDGVGLSTGPSFSYSGTPLSTGVVVSGLISGTVYKWRAAGLGLGNLGLWSNFTAPSFGIDLSSPPAPALVSITPADGSYRNYTNAAFSFESVSDTDGSGVKNYELWLATSSDFTTVFFSSQPVYPSAYVSGLSEKTYYWKVRAYDNAGNIGLWSATRSFTVDLSTPSITDNQNGDFTWRKSNSGIYNVDFADSGGSNLSKFQVKAASGPSQSGLIFADWTDVVTGINSSSYSIDWAMPVSVWNSLQEYATNYISVRVYDNAGNYSVMEDVFRVFKDTTAPSISDNQSGDDVWRNAQGTFYNIDFEDYSSGLSAAAYAARTGLLGGGTLVISTTPIPSVGGKVFTGDWQVDFASLADSVTNYISVEVYDIAGNTSTVSDVFYVKKDTTPPSVTDNQAGDDVWRNSGGTFYNVDFADDGSALAAAYYEVWTGPGKTGLKKVNTSAIPSVSGKVFSSDWQVDFASLEDSSTNYVSLQVYDAAGNSTTVQDIFYVKKDTTPPSITDNQSGDDMWRNSGGTLYNVDFADSGSGLTGAKYSAWTGPGKTGIERIALASIPSVGGKTFSSDWSVDFNSLSSGDTNYISAEVYDVAGNTVTANDLFYVKKDTIAPYLAISTPSVGYSYLNDPGNIVNVDFFDSNSGLDFVEYKITTAAAYGGQMVIDWTSFLDLNGENLYTNDWGVNFNALPVGATSYVSLRVHDSAGNVYEQPDVFFFYRQASNAPSVIDNQSGDYTWRNSSGTYYDVDFLSYQGVVNISSFAITAYTDVNKTGVMLFDWQQMASNINALSYTADWRLSDAQWNLLPPGTNYISVKVWGEDGLYSEADDVFFILKDTQPPSGLISGPLYSNALSFPVVFSISDVGPSGPQYAKLFYTYNNYAPYTWLQYGGSWTSSPVNFSASQWGKVGFRLLVYDYAGNRDELFDPPLSSTAPEFYSLADSTYPAVVNNQSGDFLWRSSSGTYYDVDFTASGGSPLDSAQYAVYSATGCSGDMIKGWTDIASGINNTSYSNDWQVDFNSLNSYTNYIANRVTNMAGNTDYFCDVFFVKKDTVPPAIANNQTGDNSWRNENNALYDIDFYDGQSMLKEFKVKITSGPGQSGTLIADWTAISVDISSSSYTENWGLNLSLWNMLPSGTSYISVSVEDNAGNKAYLSDAFYIKKDTEAPSVTDSQSGDSLWRASNSGLYSVFFADSGGSLLNEFKVRAYSGVGQTGSLLADWTQAQGGLNSNSYMSPWPLPEGFWSLLPEGTSYISVAVYDNAGNSTQLADVFYVKKDITGPSFVNNQSGDDVWRLSSGTVYNVGFNDAFSNVKGFDIRITSGSGQTGEIISDWTTVSTDINSPYYATPWTVPYSIWTLIPAGASYVSVRSSDMAGNTSYLYDAFYIKKDTIAPSVIDNQAGEYLWHALNSNYYDVDFYDSLSGVNRFQIKLTSGPFQTGAVYVDWTDNTININQPSYSSSWQIIPDIWNLAPSGTSYVSVRVFDGVGLSAVSTDTFVLLKDTVAPIAVSDLSAITGSEGEIVVSFTAPQDTGELSSYVIKYATYQINASNFAYASEYPQSWPPSPKGFLESFTLSGLEPSAVYYVAVKTVDQAGNISGVSNSPSASSGADSTAPSAISDLTASPGAFGGQINLSWTAPGDSVNIGTATAYLVRYRTDTAISNAALWNTASVYSQSWQPLGSGESESYVISGFTPGTTYYFAVRAADEVNNIGNLSNSPSAWAQFPGSRAGVMVYQSGTSNTPNYKNWDGSAFGTLATTPPTDALASSNIRHVIVKASPIRKEKMAGILSSDGVLQIQRYDQINSYWSNEWSTTTIGSNSAYRGFDIAYEQKTGRCLVLYNGATAGTLYYKIYDGTSWSPTYTLSAGSAYASLWVRLEARPDSDQILAAFSKATSLEIYAIIWNGSSWVNGQQIRAGVGITTKQDWDIAWESKSGKALVVYNNNTTGRADTYRWDGSSWSQFNSSYFSFVGANGTAQWIRLASDPNSNYIAATSVDSASDWNASIWDGSGWGYQASENTKVRNNANQSRTIDAVWSSKSSILMVVSGRGGTTNNIIFSSFTLTGGWSRTLAAAQTFGVWANRVYGVQLENDPNTDSLLLAGWDLSSNLKTASWNGYSWAFNPAASHTTTLSQYSYMPAMVTVDRHDDVPPTLADNQSGDDTWHNLNSAYYNIDAYDSGGSYLKGLQTRIYSGPSQSGIQLQDWTYQVSTAGVNEYLSDWQFLSASWNAMREGVNYISVRAMDNSLNASQTITDAFYVKKDTTAPSMPALSFPSNGAMINNQAVFLDWSDSSDSASGLAGYDILFSTDENFSSSNYSAFVSVSQTTTSVMSEGKYYWKVRAKDNAGNYSLYTSTYSLTVDTSAPVITNNQSGDSLWRNVSGTVYNVDFADNYGLSTIKYEAWTSPGRSGVNIVPETDIASLSGESSYTSDWPVNFSLLSQGTNYISVTAYDLTGNTSKIVDAFYIKKDTAAPYFVNNQTGDDVWRSSGGQLYDVDFFDSLSGLSSAYYEAWTGPGKTGVMKIAPTAIASVSGLSYSDNWSLDFASLADSSTNYISLTLNDQAGNQAVLNDAFYVKKDTTAPSIPALSFPSNGAMIKNQAVFLDWSNSSDTASGLSGYDVLFSTDENFSSINYSAFVTVSQTTTSVMSEGKYYWKVRAKDNAGNYSLYTSTYSLTVDTSAPVIINSQSGDALWRNSSGAVYNVDFADNYGLSVIKYEAWTSPGRSGVNIVPETDIASLSGESSYTSDWPVNFSLLSQGTNYISVTAYDLAGNTSQVVDAFYIKKDMVNPVIVDNQPGDDIWRAINNGVYDVDFFDGSSYVNDVEIKITTGPSQSGTVVMDWSVLYSSLNRAYFTDNWNISAAVWDLLPVTTNYVSIRVSDYAGNSSVSSDVFYIKKDTNPVNVVDNQSGDDVWRNANTAYYNVDAYSPTSPVDKLEVRVSTRPAYENIWLIPWTEALSSIGLNSFTSDWQLPNLVFDAMISGATNYVSVRFTNQAGLYNESMDLFYVKKDTVAPSVPLLSSPADFSSTNTLNVGFDWSDSYEPHSGLELYQITVSTDENFAVFSSSGNYSASNAIVALPSENKYYWKVRARDNAGNYSQWSSTYSVYVDTTAPIINDSQSGDDTWRNTNSGVYALSFSDSGGSLLDKVELRAQSASGLGGISYFGWSEAVSGINAASYSAPISLPLGLWDLLASGTGYISVAALDKAGNRSEVIDAFYIRKDTTPVYITDNQNGDDLWRSANPGAVYNVDFEDFESEISSITYKVYSSPNLGGTLVLGSTLISSSTTGFYSFNSDWSVNFAQLSEGFNYVTVNSYDRAGNSSELRDVFYIKKDTSGPIITDNQTGDDTWRAVNDGSYNVDFYDYGIGVSTISISVYTLPGKTGTQLLISSPIYAGAPVNSYTDAISLTQSQWDILRQGDNYVSFKAEDALGSISYLDDAFYIKKDTTSPSAVSSLAAYTPSSASDEGKLLLTWTATGDDGLTGSASYYMIRYSQNLIDDYSFPSASVYVSTLVPRSAGQPESLLLSGLTPGVTYYAAVKVVDKAGNISAISNSPNAYAGLDKTAPAAVSDLSSAQGDFTGQINLYWTAVGEGEAGLEGNGAAYSYLVKYSSSLWGGFDAVGVSTYTQTWVPQVKGQAEARIMEGLVPGATYSVAIKVIDEVGNISPVSNIIVATAAPAAAADGFIIYSQNGANDFKFRTWSPITWSAQYDSAQSVSANALWIRMRSVPVVSNSKIAGILYSNNSLKFFRYNGLNGSWSDITPSPMPNPAAFNYRKFDIEVENNSGRIMVAYYNNTPGAVTYAIYSATASAWVAGPSSLSLASLSGTINWVKMKALPGSNKIAIAALDSNSDISVAIWDGSAWGNNSNMTAAAALSTKEVFDIAWETLSGDLLAMWGTGTTTNYRKYYSTSTWSASTLAGPNPAAAIQWLRLSSDPLSNRIGASYLYGTTSWNAAIWRAAGTETWTASTADTTVSRVGTRIMDCAWQSKSSKFIAVAADEVGALDNKFKTAIWTGGAWTATPSAGTLNSYTVFAGSINWISLLPDPNTDNITLLGIDTAFDLRSTVWSGAAWADSSSSANFLQQNNLQSFLYESAAVDFDKHDSVPPTVIDNQSGDDIWRNANLAFYNIQATDSGGSHLAGIQTKIRTGASGGGTLVEDWTWQVSAINSDSYSTAWKLSDLTFGALPQGQSYVWVRALDGVGNISTEISDAFYVRKDSIAPQINSNLPPNSFDIWTSTGVGSIDIDFSDSGYSQISSATYSVWTGPGQTGTNQASNIIITSATAANSYSLDWNVDFSLLAAGTNYVTVSVWDNASSSATLIDAFKILKDTIAPSAVVLSAAPGPLNGTVELSWNSPGDDGDINANLQGGYIVKYATYPIATGQLFSAASTYAQSLTPLSTGSLQSLVIYELAEETTYYFAVKTYDKALNISSISNSPFSLPGRNGLFINEIYPGGNSSSDWLEFYNNTNSTVSLNNWKIIYRQGALNTSAPEVQIWSGSVSDIVPSGGVYKVNLSYDINSAQSYSVLLKNSQGYLISSLQWPSMGIGESFARIYDGYALFEIDPTPTPGYANSISTSPVKINEVSYSGYQFVELYNNSSSTLTISDYYLRNSNGAPFRFDRKLYPKAYSAIDDSSFSKDGFDFYAAFGLSGLNQSGDFAVLENSAGQTIDRVTWQSLSNYSLYNYIGQKTSAVNYAPGAATDISRLNAEGYDSDSDVADFAQALPTPYSRNTNAGQGTANILYSPVANSVLPRVFPVSLRLGADSSSGSNSVFVMVRTGGAQDQNSPHIFRLADSGFNISTLSAQTTVYESPYLYDIDGKSLVNGAVYKLLLTSDDSSKSAPMISIDNLLTDFVTHPLSVQKSPGIYLNENSSQAVFTISAADASLNYGLFFSSVIFRITDKNSVALTQQEASNLFKSVAIYIDSTIGETGKYEAAVDEDMLEELLNSSFGVDSQGRVAVSISSDSAFSALSLNSQATYYLVFRTTDNASLQTPREIMVTLDEIRFRDSINLLYQSVSGFSPLQTSTLTFIRQASAPPGTNWPYSVPAPMLVETMADFYNDGLLPNRVYISGKDGMLRTVGYDGNEKWVFVTSPASAIKTAPLIREEGGFVYLYFADSSGKVYKLKDNDSSASQEWRVDLGYQVGGNIVDNPSLYDRLYLTTNDGRVHCLNKTDGSLCSGWTYDSGFNAPISGTLSIDYRPEVNTGWIGLENGKVVAFRLSDGLILNQFITGGAIYASPFVDSAYSYANNNLYIASMDGKVYARNSANLTAVPPYWNDFNTGSSIYSSPFKGIYEDYLYVGDEAGRLYKISSTSGTISGGWVYQAPEKIRTIPVAVPGINKVFFASGEYLYCLNSNDGTLCSGYPVYTGGFIKGDIVVDLSNNVLIFSSSDGKTYMISI